MISTNLLDWCFAGIYEIYCRETDRSYFGESKNVLYRLGRHFNDLQAQQHETLELQQDWQKYGRSAFVFRPLDIGPAFG